MNSLELLQKSGREKFSARFRSFAERPHQGGIELTHNEARTFLEEIITHTYETAIKDCLDSLPEIKDESPSIEKKDLPDVLSEEDHAFGWNDFRSEIKAKLEALLPNNK